MSSGALHRLRMEAKMLRRSPVEGAYTAPNPNNVLEWHYVLEGALDTPYEGGRYHGMLRFPADFPFKPPAIFMFTPSGRFETNKSICLSMSEYHPESWNPAWTVASILRAVQSFMAEDTPSTGTVIASFDERVRLAALSHATNLTDPTFCELFRSLPPPPPPPGQEKLRAMRRAPAPGVAPRSVSLSSSLAAVAMLLVVALAVFWSQAAQ